MRIAIGTECGNLAPMPRWGLEATGACWQTVGLAAGLFCATALGSPTILDPAQVAQKYAQRAWQKKDGLPDNQVQALLQTRDGYLWIGTRRGLARFDGLKKRSQIGPETIFLLARRLTALHAPRMKKTRGIKWALAFFSGIAVACMAGGPAQAQPAEALPKAFIDGTGPGWRALGEADFKKVNCATNTWTWTNGVIYCTGQPMGVTRSQNLVTNLELVVEWRHLRSGGNSGLYLWATERSIRQLEAGDGPFPEGIEVQVLDHGYTEQYERETKKKADWFTTHGDVFPTEKAQMTPFSPAAPSGMRSFPRKHLSKGVGEWNHYYVRAINGEIRLWVNGEEVSGGTGCKPAFGYLCLESEGSPVEFRNLRIRELP